MKSSTLFGIAAIIAATALHRFPRAQAGDIGPSVSYGQNPIFMESGSFTTTPSWTTINALQAPSNQNAIITHIDVDCKSSNSNRKIQTSGGTTFYDGYGTSNTITFARLGIVIEPSESLDIVHAQYGSTAETCSWYILGYYTHY